MILQETLVNDMSSGKIFIIRLQNAIFQNFTKYRTNI